MALHLGDALRPHRGTVLVLAVLAEVVVLGGLVALRGEDAAVAVAVSFMALTAVVAGTLAGARVGVVVALAGGAIFYLTVADLGSDASPLATAVSAGIWVLAALVSGVIAEALREQVTQQEVATVALTAARTAGKTAERLLAATASFHGGDSLEDVADDVCRTAVGFFGCDSATVLLAEEATLRRLAGSAQPAAAGSGRLSLADHPGLTRLVALRRPAFFGDPTSTTDLDADVAQSLASVLPAGALVFVPVRPGEEPLGLLALAWPEKRARPDDESMAVMQRFSDQAAIALLEARRAEARSEVARLHATLEAGLLPTMPLDHPDLEIATAYRPGEDRLLLGGDFYDVLPLSDGRLALIVGDVSGHGPQAAALGARLRAGWQALTLSGATPTTILGSLEEVVVAQGDSELLATVVLAWIDPATRSAALMCAGHPPPLLLSRTVHRVHLRPDLPLGVQRNAKPRTTTVRLPRQWTLLFYTDGLIEGLAAPASRERYGEERLMALLDSVVGTRFDAATLDGLLGIVEKANGGAFGDDVAVVAVSTRREVDRRRRRAPSGSGGTEVTTRP